MNKAPCANVLCRHGAATVKERALRAAARGNPVLSVPRGKTRTTIRLDDNLLEWFREQPQRADGGGYQNPINDALREHIRRAGEPLEVTLHRVVREELQFVA